MAVPVCDMTCVEMGLRASHLLSRNPKLGGRNQGNALIGKGKATGGNICTPWLQARRARSDAPYHQGIAASHFQFMANFGVRDQVFQKVLPSVRCLTLIWPRMACQPM